jgi:hypothetical protein
VEDIILLPQIRWKDYQTAQMDRAKHPDEFGKLTMI